MSREREPLVTHIFTADPSAHVYNGKIYIYPSHDIPHNGEDNDNGDEYQMQDYHVLTMDDISAECIDHGVALHMEDVPGQGDQMWAPDAVYIKTESIIWSFRQGIKKGISGSALQAERIRRVRLRRRRTILKEVSALIQPPLQMTTGKCMFILADCGADNWKNTGREYLIRTGRSLSPCEPAVMPRCAVMSEDMLSFEKGPVEIEILDENGELLLRL